MYLRAPRYFAQLQSIVSQQNTNRTLLLLDIWNLFKQQRSALPGKYQAMSDKLAQLLGGDNAKTSRADQCLAFTQRAGMGFVLGNAYIDKEFKNSNVDEAFVHQLMTDVRAAFQSRLRALQWLTAADREKAATKVSQCTI